MKKSTSLITGGAGFIGSHIAHTLVKKGHNVIVFDDFSSGSLDNLKDIEKQIKVIKGDITDFNRLKKAFKGVDYVYHHAALVSVAQSMSDPRKTQKINIEGANNVLEAARINGVKKVLLASSSAVYGNGKEMPYREEGPTDCRSPYAASKLTGEKLLKMYNKAYGLNTVIVRYFNVFGPGQNPNSPYAAVIAKFMQCAQQGKEFCIDWDGKQSRDFVFVDDIVAATVLVMQKGKAGEVYNIASGKTYTLLRLASLIEDLYGKKIKRVFKPKRAGDVKKSCADISKIKKLGFKPAFTLEKGLKAMLQTKKTTKGTAR